MIVQFSPSPNSNRSDWLLTTFFPQTAPQTGSLRVTNLPLMYLLGRMEGWMDTVGNKLRKSSRTNKSGSYWPRARSPSRQYRTKVEPPRTDRPAHRNPFSSGPMLSTLSFGSSNGEQVIVDGACAGTGLEANVSPYWYRRRGCFPIVGMTERPGYQCQCCLTGGYAEPHLNESTPVKVIWVTGIRSSAGCSTLLFAGLSFPGSLTFESLT